ncbi:hypothetical protein [Mycolicibacterium iranicum]|uniref:Uncharacterized protein n=1 Tax=Mycolicibacterium iranicum TaxID=912594 RepID=A0ABT4HL70_MYCIR|nr:hypothetical protein [Mycolicibacterium iranicum]MCZ0730905.1 hypothetical protein [Mycolicibacterium iranicum]
MSDLWPLLTGEPLDGDTVIHRQLRPAGCAVPVDCTDLGGAAHAVIGLCNSWGGSAMPLIPVTPKTAIDPRWHRVLLQSNIDGIRETDLLDKEEIAKFSDIQGGDYRQLLLRILIDLDDPKPTVLTCRGVPANNEWYLAYLGLFGDLPAKADPMNTWNELRRDLTYEEVVTIRGVEGEVGAAGLAALIHDRRAVSAVDLTRSKLSVGVPAATNRGLVPESSRFEWDDDRISRRYGPNVIVVYRPGSVEDLALLWNLRARFAHPSGLPLAIPMTDTVEQDIATLKHANVEHYFGGGHSVALTSFSVISADLVAVAKAHNLDIVDPWNLLGPISGYCVPSTETAHFTAGSAKIPDFTATDTEALGLSLLGSHQGSWMQLKTTVADDPLPLSRTMRRPFLYGELRYLDGPVTSGGHLNKTTLINQPSGMEVLAALAADSDLVVAQSSPGKAAEHLIRAAEGGLSMLAAPGVVTAISELTRGRHVSLVKRRLNQFLIQEDLDQSADRYQLLFDRLDRAVGDPDVDEAGYLTFNQLKQLLRMSQVGAERWLRWATGSGLILRGVEAKCDRCGHKQWRLLIEVIPTLICHGCASPIENAHGPNHIEYRYRASELLLRAMADDVLPSVLAIRYIASIMGGKRGMVFGAYPGIELRTNGSSVIDAEFDVLAVLRTGGLIVGECKTNARGLTSGELDKLWKAADQVDARATFAATLDSARNCDSLWRVQSAPNGRPHFALTAEHLFDLQVTGSGINKDLFEWRDDYPTPRGQEGPPGSDAIDAAFSRFAEGTSTDHQQLRRAPWMSPEFIDPTRQPVASVTVDDAS